MLEVGVLICGICVLDRELIKYIARSSQSLKKAHRFYLFSRSLNKNEWIIFRVVWLMYTIVFCIIHTLPIEYVFTNFLLKYFESLLGFLVGALLFYLVVNVLIINISEIQYELEYCLEEYKDMKKDIARILLVCHKVYASEELIEKISLYPKEARSYFTHDTFREILDSLDEYYIQQIRQNIQPFIETLIKINHRFVKSGDDSFAKFLSWFREIESSMDYSKIRFLDWTEKDPKSTHRLYLLFCQDFQGKDPFLLKVTSILSLL